LRSERFVTRWVLSPYGDRPPHAVIVAGDVDFHVNLEFVACLTDQEAHPDTRHDAGTSTNVGRKPRLTGALLLANLGTRRLVNDPAAVDDRLAVALWHELGCGVDAGSEDRRRLPIPSSAQIQQAPRHRRCRDGAATSPSTATLLLQA
jgi:hypothetical protein